MSWIRCTRCATFFDTDRFARCCICGHEYVLPPPAPGAPADEPARGPAVEGRPPVEEEAAADRTIAGWATAGGIFMGLLGPIALSGMPGSAQGTLIFGFLVLLVVLAIFGAGAKSKADPVRFAAGRVARTALTTIAVAIGAVAVLGAGLFVITFVACVTGSGRGFGS